MNTKGKKSGNSTDFFYKEIAAPYIASLSETITFTHFNLRDYKKPLREEVLDLLPARPKLLERKPIAERITARMLGFVETFISGMGLR